MSRSAAAVEKASDLQGGMHKSHLAPPCLSVNSPFASDFTFVYALIIGLLLTSKSQNMIIILEFPNGKNVNWEVQQNVNDHTYKFRKPSFTASATSPRILVHAKPCPKSTFYRFKFHLRIIPGRGKCILCSQVVTLWSRDQRNLTWVPNCLIEHGFLPVFSIERKVMLYSKDF